MYCNLYLCVLIVIYGFRLANSKKDFCIKDKTLIEINILDPHIQVLSWMRCYVRFIYWGIHHFTYLINLEKCIDLIFTLEKMILILFLIQFEYLVCECIALI